MPLRWLRYRDDAEGTASGGEGKRGGEQKKGKQQRELPDGWGGQRLSSWDFNRIQQGSALNALELDAGRRSARRCLQQHPLEHTHSLLLRCQPRLPSRQAGVKLQ